MQRGKAAKGQSGKAVFFAALIATLIAPLPLCPFASLTEVVVAQKPQATFKSSVELVNVDVVVVDRDGNAVRGLQQRDFALTDRKKPQAITNFEEVSHERVAVSPLAALPPTVRMDVISNQSTQADRLVMLVVDDLHIFKDRTDKARELARDVITKLGAQASMAVLFTSGEHSTQITEDRAELLAAVDTLKGRQSWRRPHQAIDTQRAAAISGDGDALAALDTVGKSQETSLQDFEENMQQFQTLQDAAKMLGSEDVRRKAFVMISEGINKEMNGIFDSAMTPCEMSMSAACYHDRALKDMMEAMRRSNVATYAIDPRGQVKAEDMQRELHPAPLGGDPVFRWNNPIRRAQDGLSFLTEASGGFAVTDTDDLTSGLQRIIEDIDHYYLLGFYPDDASGGDKYRPLAVTVIGHPEYTLRFRHGYRPGAPPAPTKNKDPLVALAAGVMPRTDLPLRITALALVGTAKTASVAVALEVTAPTGLMKDADSKLRDDLEYSVLVVDDKKAKVTSRTGRAAKLALTTRDNGAAMPDTVTYQMPFTLDLPPGRYQLRASAMSKKLNRGGSVYIGITVPDFAKAPLVLSGIALGYADGAHVPVGRTAPPAGRGGTPPTNIMLGGSRGIGIPSPQSTLPPAQQRAAQGPVNRLPFDPSLGREFTSADTLRAYFEVARKDLTSTVSLTIMVVDSTNRSIMAIDRVVSPNDPGRIDLRVPLAPLGPGAYRLRVIATDSRTVASTETGLLIK